MISTLPNIGIFRFDHDRNKLFIFSIFVSHLNFSQEIESKCFKFIWNGKPDKVNRNTLIGDFEKDGLKMIAVDSHHGLVD
jgi:hypothetical protein